MFVKKRVSTNKRNIRQAAGENASDESDSDAVDFEAIAELKMEQNARKKGKGIATFSNSDDSTLKREIASKKPIESLMNSQFASQLVGDSSVTKHEQLMEKYVQDKLGLTLPNEHPASTELTPEDLVYRVPDHIRAPEPISSGTESTLMAAGSGIAEIALPIRFKLSNIEATEAARKKLNEDGISVSNSATNLGYGSQQKVASRKGPGFTKESSSLVATVELPSSFCSGYIQKANTNSKKTGRHDDLFVDKFVKATFARKHK